ncbi:hypothetical protein Cs308_0178 [Candidatus Chlamydia sanziniae]|uniref:Uncharacterized protein n=2 Tax=Candidatus Chlamydia sanziniae TaxID=1806891 RepID=A0A1A9HTN1_9CHLA|nr:hypothetical protein Cs308_0178 [Candidatus Chlamydia sanziniae]
MLATAMVIFLFAFILVGISLLPQVLLPFSGVYFVIGSFLIFASLGILIINLTCDSRYYCLGLFN